MSAHARPGELRRVLVRMALPPLALAVVYLVAVRMPLAREVAATRARIETLRPQAPTESSAALQRRQLDELTKQVEAARAAREQGTLQAAVVAERSALQRARLREELTVWMGRHDLALTAEEHRPEPIERGQQPVLGLSIASGSLPSWRLEFYGGYLDVLAAMRELAGSELGVIPLRLELRRSARGLTCTLLVV